MLSENKLKQGKGIFRAALGPWKLLQSWFCYRKVVRSARNYSDCDREKTIPICQRLFSLSIAATFSYYLWEEGQAWWREWGALHIITPPNVQDGKQLLQAKAVCTAPPPQEQWQGWPRQARPSCELAPLTFHWWAVALHGMVLQDVLVQIQCAHGTKHL